MVSCFWKRIALHALSLCLLASCARPVENDTPADLDEDPSAQIFRSYFDSYILKAVASLNEKYRLLGYDISKLYTHDLDYGKYGQLVGTPGPKTMCVAAVLEIIVTAMNIYAKETGDKKVFDYLPIKSWKSLGAGDIKGHIWVNSDFDSHGTADALVNFGMGERVPFEKLKPGAFINLNRTSGSGHAVVFIAFIDKEGREFTKHNSEIVGFKYFSAQGRAAEGEGGFDYRYAVFSKNGCPTMPHKRDCNVLYSTDRKTLNTGRMWAPKSWRRPPPSMTTQSFSQRESVFDAAKFDGITTDDN